MWSIQSKQKIGSLKRDAKGIPRILDSGGGEGLGTERSELTTRHYSLLERSLKTTWPELRFGMVA